MDVEFVEVKLFLMMPIHHQNMIEVFQIVSHIYHHWLNLKLVLFLIYSTL